MTADHGSDFSCVEDIDANLSTVSGRTCLIQALVRRLLAPRGSLWSDPNYGADIREFLNTPARVEVVSQVVQNECLKDERVEDVSADVEYLDETETLQIKLAVTDEDGPFALTLLVGALTYELLTESL